MAHPMLARTEMVMVVEMKMKMKVHRRELYLPLPQSNHSRPSRKLNATGA